MKNLLSTGDMHQKYTRQAKDSIQCIKRGQERVMKAKVSKLDIPSDDSDKGVIFGLSQESWSTQPLFKVSKVLDLVLAGPSFFSKSRTS